MGKPMKLSIVVPVLNSHEIVRRQLLYFKSMDLPDDVEIIYVDDGSDPPHVYPDDPPANFRFVVTNDFRPWTWALARNRGAKEAEGENLLMADLDYIIPKTVIETARGFTGDYMGFQREFGVLDENGKFTQDHDVLTAYGLPKERITARGTRIPPHPNDFIIRRQLFLDMRGYREDLIGKQYPQGEDNAWKQKRKQWASAGKLIEAPERPTIYMFPNGRFCGDVDYNPHNLFHNLSRKSDKNPFTERKADGSVGYNSR